MKIKIITERCTGCGSCAALCPESIELKEIDGQMKAVITNPKAECASAAPKDLVAICPEEAIVIEE